MAKRSLRSLLNDYFPDCKQQQQLKAKFLAFEASSDQVFKRSHLVGHFCGSAWVVDYHAERVVLMHHKKLQKWLQPGGHCDGDVDVEAVARKEAAEETGLDNLTLVVENIFDLDLHAIPEHKGVPAHLHYDVRFLFRAPEGARLVQNEESHALQWFPLSATFPTAEESVLRLQRKALAVIESSCVSS
ncbi:MAG: NUDIX hydrolase [Zetaproteobacteria bacterium]|nr:NUDIX hydrolase [Zetaproteobacteria bacterium]